MIFNEMKKRLNSKYFIYFYYHDDVSLYIGKATTSPFIRYVEHCENGNSISQNFDIVNKFGIIELQSQSDMEIAELYLIATCKPLWNIRELLKSDQTIYTKILNMPEIKYYSYEEFESTFNIFNQTVKHKKISQKKADEITCSPVLSAYNLDSDKVIDEYNLYLVYSHDKLIYICGDGLHTGHTALMEQCRNMKLKKIPEITNVKVLVFKTRTEQKIAFIYITSTCRPEMLKKLPIYKSETNLEVQIDCFEKETNDVDRWNLILNREYADHLSLYKNDKRCIKGHFGEEIYEGDHIFDLSYEHLCTGWVIRLSEKTIKVEYADGFTETKRVKNWLTSLMKVYKHCDTGPKDAASQPIIIGDLFIVIDEFKNYMNYGVHDLKKVIRFTNDFVVGESVRTGEIGKKKFKKIFVCNKNYDLGNRYKEEGNEIKDC